MTKPDEIIVPLSDISIDIVSGLGVFSSCPCARILIDEKPLVDMVRAYEMKMLAGDKEAGLAGLYWYLQPLSLIEYLEGDGFVDDHRIALLGCTCLDEDCWPLVCSVDKQKNYIILYDFFQPHRRQWDYSSYGPFAFEKRQLAAALDSLKTLYGNLPLTNVINVN